MVSTTPSEKYDCQNGSFPTDRGENKKIFELPPPRNTESTRIWQPKVFDAMSINIIIPKAMSLCLAIQLSYTFQKSKIRTSPVLFTIQIGIYHPSSFFSWHQPHQLCMDPWWMSHGVLGPVTQIVGKVPCMNVLCLWPCEFSRTLGEYHLFEWKTG